MLLKRNSSQTQRPAQTKSQGMKKILHANNREKKADVAVLVSHKTEFKTKKIIKR